MRFKIWTAIFLLTGFSLTANAALVGRLPDPETGYQAYYDTVLNVTWLTDTTYDMSLLGFSPFDYSWDDVNATLPQATIGGISEWRLPTIEELDYMVLINGISGATPGPFLGIYPPDPMDPSTYAIYFSSTSFDDLGGSDTVWGYNLTHGVRDLSPRWWHHNVWAVHSGDIAPVPLPAAAWLFGSALIGMLPFVRSRQRHCLA